MKRYLSENRHTIRLSKEIVTYLRCYKSKKNLDTENRISQSFVQNVKFSKACLLYSIMRPPMRLFLALYLCLKVSFILNWLEELFFLHLTTFEAKKLWLEHAIDRNIFMVHALNLTKCLYIGVTTYFCCIFSWNV